MSIHQRIPLNPDAWQRRVVTSMAPRIIVNAARRVGKSTVCAVAGLDTAIGSHDRRIILISQNQQQAGVLMRTMSAFVTRLDVPVRRQLNTSLDLANGSDMLLLVATDTRALYRIRRPHLVIVDDAALAPDETIEAVQAMDAMRIILLSTVARPSGAFHYLWKNATDWHREMVPADQCSWMDGGTLARMRAAMGPAYFAREMECRFT